MTTHVAGNSEAAPLPARATGVLAAIVAVKVMLHAAGITRYGYFRDELYYLASTAHLDWGYVDHPPLSIAVLALVRAVLGDSLVALRLVPLLAGVATIWMVGTLARRFGGGAFAQGLAALAALCAPVYLGTHHVYSMNAIDLLLWVFAAHRLLDALERGTVRAWLGLGLVVGLGLLNKLSMTWFVGAFVAALLLTPHRRRLLAPGPWVALAVAIAMAAPNIAWQVAHGWPTAEFMANATRLKMANIPFLDFARQQWLQMNPAAVFVWGLGLAWGLRPDERRRGRVFVVLFLAVLAIVASTGRSRPSYLAVAYPPLFALGAVACERLAAGAGRRALRVAMAAIVAAGGAFTLPFAIPVLSPEAFVRYQRAVGMAPRTDERLAVGALPQHYADMFGWPELVALVASAYERLSPEERARCRVFGQNYGEAGAIDVLGRRLGLPPALSGHNSYWLWGTGGWEGDVLIIIGGDRDDNAEFFEDIEIVGQTDSPWAMPYERGLDVSIARKPKVRLEDAWPMLRRYI